MALSANAKHAIRQSLGQNAGTEVIGILDFVSDKINETKRDDARDTKILDAAVASVVAAVAPTPVPAAPAKAPAAAPAGEEDPAAHDAPV